jgi:hypothetical protein
MEIHERVPDYDELSEILLLLSCPASALVVQASSAYPTSAKMLHKLATQDPTILKRPIVIYWDKKLITVSKVGCPLKNILHELVRWRDKKDEKGEPPPPPPSKPPDEWIDYD